MQGWYEGWVEPREILLRAGREEGAHAHIIEKIMHDTALMSGCLHNLACSSMHHIGRRHGSL